jgi:hypothetical protein
MVSQIEILYTVLACYWRLFLKDDVNVTSSNIGGT